MSSPAFFSAPTRSFSHSATASIAQHSVAPVHLELGPVEEGYWTMVGMTVVWGLICLYAQWRMVRGGTLRKEEREVGY